MPAGDLSPRPLGSSGMDVSALSLGSWRTFERLPPETGVAILRAARRVRGHHLLRRRPLQRRDGPGPDPDRVLRGAVRGAVPRCGPAARRDGRGEQAVVGVLARAERRRGAGRLPAAHALRPRGPDLRQPTAGGPGGRRPGGRRRRARRRREGPRVGPGELARRSLRPGGRGGRGPRDRTALRGPAALQPGAAVLGRGRRHEAGGHAGGRRGRRLVLPGGRRVDRQVPVRCRGGPPGRNARRTPVRPGHRGGRRAGRPGRIPAHDRGRAGAGVPVHQPGRRQRAVRRHQRASSSGPTAPRPRSGSGSARTTSRRCCASGCPPGPGHSERRAGQGRVMRPAAGPAARPRAWPRTSAAPRRAPARVAAGSSGCRPWPRGRRARG